MKTWYSAADLAGVTGLPGTPRRVCDIAKRRDWQSRPRVGRGGGLEYHIDSLPHETQAYLRAQAGAQAPTPSIDAPQGAGQVIAGPWSATSAAPAPVPVMTAAPPVDPASFPPAAPVPSLDDLQAWSAERALRLSQRDLADPAVQAKIAVSQAMETCAWGRREETLAALAQTHNVSCATIRRWLDEVQSWRLRSRVPAVQLCDTVIELPRAKAFCQDAIKRGIEIYAGNLHNGMKAAYVALRAESETAGWRVGDYSTFTRLLGKIPDKVWEYIRKGETGFELSTAPKIIRAWLSVPAYSVVCGDQNIPDYQVYDPATGEIYTPELYLWMDCTSRAWVGLWPAWGHYSRYTVGYALREACRIATPGEAFTDWGKPETSHYSAQIVAGLRGHVGCGDWSEYAGRFAGRDAIGDPAEGDITHRKTTRVGIPWQKPIEPQMAVLRREYLNRFTPGFRQRLPGAWENDERTAALKRQRDQGKLLSTEEFLELTRDIAVAHNAKPFVAKETPTPIVPAQVLERGLREAPRTVFDDQTLDHIFLPRVVRAPMQSTVRVMAGPGDLRRYHAHELSLIGRGERVQVAFDPFDPAAPAVLTTLRGDYIGLAEPWDVQQPGDDQGLADKIRRQMSLMKWWREQVRALRGDVQSIPRIAVATKTARAAAAAESAKPDKGAAKRADAKLIDLYGGT